VIAQRHPVYVPGIALGLGYFPFAGLYALARLLKPDVVVETGGISGSSSAFILRAMRAIIMARLLPWTCPAWTSWSIDRRRKDLVRAVAEEPSSWLDGS
jgi:hypothetical protein